MSCPDCGERVPVLFNSLKEANNHCTSCLKKYRKKFIVEQKGCHYPKVVDAGRKIIEQPKRYEWANISGEYKRARSDWVMLCPSCHRKIDMGKEELCVL